MTARIKENKVSSILERIPVKPKITFKLLLKLGSTPKELQIIPEFAQVLDFPL